MIKVNVFILREKYLYIVLILMLSLMAQAQHNDNIPWWETVNYCNSTTVYGRVTIDGQNASDEDLIAVFVGNECRGWQQISYSNGNSYVTIVANGEQPELLQFYFYQAETRRLCPVNFTVLSSPGSSIGYPPDFLPLAATTNSSNTLPACNLPETMSITEPTVFTWEMGSDIYDAEGDLLYLDYTLIETAYLHLASPSWQPQSGSGNTQMFAEVNINGQPAEQGDIVAAFINGQCRGINTVSIWNNKPFVSLSVIGTQILPVSFRIYDISEQRSWAAIETYNCQPGGMVGYPDLLQVDGVLSTLESDLSIEFSAVPQPGEILSLFISDAPPVSQIRLDITINENLQNHPPELILPFVQFPEDEQHSLDLLQYANDPDDDLLSFQIFNNSPVNTQLCGQTLNFYPSANWFGSTEMQILVSDGQRAYDMDTLQIEVLPVNDPPQIEYNGSMTANEDVTLLLDLSGAIYDIDDNNLMIDIDAGNHLEITATPPQWQLNTLSSFANAYLTVSSNAAELPQDAQIAAFINNECRGLANLNTYQGTNYAFIQIFTENTRQVTFKVYDPQTQKILSNSQQIVVSPGSNLGFPPDYYPLNLDILSESYCYQVIPELNWFGTTVAEITVFDPQYALDSQQISFTFLPQPDPPELNFDAPINFLIDANDWIDLTAFCSDPDGDDYSLQILSASGLNLSLENRVLHIQQAPHLTAEYSIEIQIEDSTGLSTSASADIIIREPQQYEAQLVTGWNWISLPLGSNHRDPQTILSSLNGSVDYMKSQVGFLQYSPQFGWLGTISELSALSLYKVRLHQGETLSYTGWQLNPEETAISINEGWNWISYLPDVELPIDEAMQDMEGSVQFVKYLNAYSLFYPQFGWIGSLFTLLPNKGYIVYALNDQEFVYPSSSRNLSAEYTPDPPQNQIINPHDYEYTASLTAVIRGYTPQPDDVLLARAGDVVAGYATLQDNTAIDLSHLTGEYYWFIYLHTNQLAPQALTIELQQEDGTTRIIKENLYWKPDDILGTIEEPITFDLPDTNEKPQINKKVGRIYPNPIISGSRSQVSLQIDQNNINLPLHAALYNIKGQKTANLNIDLTRSDCSLSDKNNWVYPAGVYFVRIVDEQGFISQSKLLIFSTASK